MRHRSRAALPAAKTLRAALLSTVVVVGACSDSTSLVERFDALPSTPGAEFYEGSLESELDSQVVAIVADGTGALGGSRVEQLAEGETWASHIAWRTDHVGDRELQPVGATDPDPRRATFVGDDDSVVVLGRETDDGRLVVMTALLGEP